MTRTTHDELAELTGAYVLGMLGDDDRRAVEAHLATCEVCAREVGELGAVADGLAYAVPQVDPPPALRARVLAAATAGSRPPAQAVAPAPTRAAPWMAIAASIAAVALGIYALTLRERIETLQQQLRIAETRAADVERDLQITRATSDRAVRIASVLEAPDVRSIDLAGQKEAPAAAGRAFWSPSQGLVVTATNLPTPRPGRQYQLWVIPPGGKPLSAGLLDLGAGGRTIAVVDRTLAVNVGTVAVSEEPAGGVPQPTGAIVLAGAL